MGQQQLLLIILVTVIVGITTVIAINTFNEASINANLDAIQQDILQAQAISSGYLNIPISLGGGSGSYEGITLKDLSLPDENENAFYELGDIQTESFQIIANSDRGFTLTATIQGDQITWTREDLE